MNALNSRKGVSETHVAYRPGTARAPVRIAMSARILQHCSYDPMNTRSCGRARHHARESRERGPGHQHRLPYRETLGGLARDQEFDRDPPTASLGSETTQSSVQRVTGTRRFIQRSRGPCRAHPAALMVLVEQDPSSRFTGQASPCSRRGLAEDSSLVRDQRIFLIQTRHAPGTRASDGCL